MNTLIAVAIAPYGVGDELAPEIAEVVKVDKVNDILGGENEHQKKL